MATDVNSYETYDEITGRLDQIVADVRNKDTSLERSLDLLDEAIELGSRAVEMVDKVEFTPEEQEALEEGASGAEAGEAEEDGEAGTSDSDSSDAAEPEPSDQGGEKA
jgi:exonuclease VII small subunit